MRASILGAGSIACVALLGSAAQAPADGHARMLAELAALSGSNQRDSFAGPAARLRQAAATIPPDTPADRRAAHLGSVAIAELRTGDFAAARSRLSAVVAIAGEIPEAARKANLALAEYYLGVTWLREAMDQACVRLRADDSCILPVVAPIAGPAAAMLETAIGHLQRVVRVAGPDSPSGLAARWLERVAAEIRSAEHPRPGDVGGAGAAGALRQRFRNVAAAVGIDAFDFAGGMVVDDFDGDGRLDVFSTTTDIVGQVHLYRNVGDGRFAEVTERAGLTGITGGLNAVQADYDNDGDLDLLILRGAWRSHSGRWPNSLLRNDGAMRFRDVTFEVGLGDVHYPTQVGVWADYDNDGDLDLYVANEATEVAAFPSQLFRNDAGKFVDVASAAGVANFRWSKSAAWGDYDGDGWADLYVSNLHGANRLYRNLRDGTFEDVAADLGVDGPSSSFAAWFWDANEDGRLDLLVNSYQLPAAGGPGDIWHAAADRLGVAHPADLSRLYLGNATGFAEVGSAWGIARSNLPMAANFGDLDNDGWLDFYLGTGYPGFEGVLPNVMYRNDAGFRFVEVSAGSGLGHLAKGHGIAFADVDNDGDQDVLQQLGGFSPGDQYYNALFENPGAGGNWLGLELRGVDSNRFGVGARVRAVVIDPAAGRRVLHRIVGSGGSFGASPLGLHLGLGAAPGLASVEVDWPGGGTDRWGPLAANAYYRGTEGRGVVRIERPPFTLARSR